MFSESLADILGTEKQISNTLIIMANVFWMLDTYFILGTLDIFCHIFFGVVEFGRAGHLLYEGTPPKGTIVIIDITSHLWKFSIRWLYSGLF